jgi:hypothetical protein
MPIHPEATEVQRRRWTGLFGNDNAAASGLPYGDQTDIQCSSCHRARDWGPGSASASFNYILEQSTSSSNVQTLCVYFHTY